MPSTEELAEDRTDLAEDRTVLANERTFAGWMRTGLATIGIALGFQAIFGRVEPAWAPKLVATGILGVGIIIFWMARQRAIKLIERLNTHRIEPISKHHLTTMAALLGLCAVALAVGVWTLEW